MIKLDYKYVSIVVLGNTNGSYKFVAIAILGNIIGSS